MSTFRGPGRSSCQARANHGRLGESSLYALCYPGERVRLVWLPKLIFANVEKKKSSLLQINSPQPHTLLQRSEQMKWNINFCYPCDLDTNRGLEAIDYCYCYTRQWFVQLVSQQLKTVRCGAARQVARGVLHYAMFLATCLALDGKKKHMR